MDLEKIIDSIKNYRSRKKIWLDQYVDPSLAWIGANMGYVWGSDKVLDFVTKKTDTFEGLALFGTYLGLAAGAIALNKYVIVPVAKKIKEFHQHRLKECKRTDAKSWLRTAGQVGSLLALYSALNIGGAVGDFKNDTERVIDALDGRGNPPITRVQDDVPPLKEELSMPKELKAEMPNTLVSKNIKDTNIYSDEGRFLRTYRWNKFLSAAEKKHNLEEGLLAGLVMQESCGNPVALGSGNDGDAGLMMFIPGTAQEYGLKTYGKSKANCSDKKHGKKLKALVKQKNYNYVSLSDVDDRFNVPKSVDAGAEFLKDLYERFGSWDDALSAYNQGTPAKKPHKTTHVKRIREYQKYYNQNKHNF